MRMFTPLSGAILAFAAITAAARIRTGRTVGWVEQDQFGLTCPNNARKAG